MMGICFDTVFLPARTFPLGVPSDLFTLPQCGNAGCSDDTTVAPGNLILQFLLLRRAVDTSLLLREAASVSPARY